jgi:acyl-CoA thioesterase I
MPQRPQIDPLSPAPSLHGWLFRLVIALAIGLPAAHAAPAKRTVLILGDSLSAAYGMDTSQGWVSLMAGELAKSGIAVVNASVTGETTQGGRSRIASELARVKPQAVVVALGGNDGLRGLPLIETRKNLAAIVQAAKAKGARVVLAGMQIPPNYGLDYAREFRELYAELARKEKIELVPFMLEGIAERLEYFQPDRIHPSVAAQPLILKNMMPAMQKALAATEKARAKP